MIRLNTVGRASARPGARTFLVLATLALSAFAGRAHAFCNPGEVDTCDVYGVPGTRICGLNGVYGPCNTDEPTPPPVPVRPQVIGRTADTLKLKWEDNTRRSDVLYRLQHEEGSTWVDLVTLARSGAEFDHSGLPPDTRHCYRVTATNSLGSQLSIPTCRYTTDGTGRKVARLQLELQTADVDDADTDDDIRVILTDDASGLRPNLTWLDYGGDFEVGDTLKYDLNVDDIAFLGDIATIVIVKDGTDGWCLAGFRLLVNGESGESFDDRPVTVYQEDFHHLPAGCLWLDGEDGNPSAYEVDHDRLRAHPLWQAYRTPRRLMPGNQPPFTTEMLRIRRQETEERVEGMIGHLIHGAPVEWGGMDDRAYVEANPGQYPGLVAVSLDLETWLGVDLDVYFDLHYEAKCSPDQTRAIVDVRAESLRTEADLSWLCLVLPCAPVGGPLDWITALEDYIAAKATRALPSIPSFDQPTVGKRCVGAETIVRENADVELVFLLAPPLPPPPPPPPPPQAPDVYATFDSASRAPSCGTTIGRSCMADGLLMGRGAGHETFAPNTIGGSCAEDRASFQRPLERSVEYISVSTTDGSPLEPGREVRIDAGITALEYWLDAVDFFYTTDADHPNWTLIGTAVPSWEGETLSMSYRLPEGPRQAVRVQIRRDGASEPCSPARRSDRDDLIFAVRSRLTSS